MSLYKHKTSHNIAFLLVTFKKGKQNDENNNGLNLLNKE